MQDHRLFFDNFYQRDVGFKNFAKIFGHSGRDSVSNKDNYHCGERDYQAVAAVISRSQNAPYGAVDDVAGKVENNFRDGDPKNRFYYVLL